MSVIRQIGPNWFTTVMGIGIVSGLTFTSPLHIDGQQVTGEILFGILNVVFITAIFMWGLRWILHSSEAMDDFRHPTRALFYGALSMAINVVGNDYLLVGANMFNSTVAIDISKVIWIVGAAASLFTVIVVPYLLFTEHQVEHHQTVASWLIPVVPPIVAGATGMNLIPYWPSAQLQLSLTVVCIAFFGITFFLFIMISSLVYGRLVYYRRLNGESTPSLWIEIGPIGMSMATLCELPVKTQAILSPYTNILHGMAMVISIALWGVGVWWIVISSMHTILHLSKRGDGLPFNLGWWSYVFPIGSFTNGTYALTHLMSLQFFTVAGFVQLLILWICFIVVAIRTAIAVAKGHLIQWTFQRHSHHPMAQKA
ncbi:C4-dicarboxylate ABC transporter [Alicyclobacillus acidiphilus]|uniref:SLAC1 family transporter n=1 Tax=Alicyclobacillus acidiphilus TaxID=182455 RepID=UPI000833457C|nr:C4-dicarboxylate ABC transporter [Alicyclobacillus acidiphilus]